MTKTKVQVLEEIYDRTLAVITDSEIQIEYLKKQDPKMVVFTKVEMFGGTPMKKEFTAEMLIKKEEDKLKENREVLSIVDRNIEEETSKEDEEASENTDRT